MVHLPWSVGEGCARDLPSAEWRCGGVSWRMSFGNSPHCVCAQVLSPCKPTCLEHVHSTLTEIRWLPAAVPATFPRLPQPGSQVHIPGHPSREWAEAGRPCTWAGPPALSLGCWAGPDPAPGWGRAPCLWDAEWGQTLNLRKAPPVSGMLSGARPCTWMGKGPLSLGC